MQSIPQLFESSVNQFGDNTLILEKIDGSYKELSYNDIASEVYAAGMGLIDLGLKKGERVALLSDGRSDWLVSELAIFYAGAASVPISVKINEPEDLLFRLEHSGTRFVIVSDLHLPKVREIANRLKKVEKVILLDEVADPGKKEIYLKDIKNAGLRKQDTLKPVLEKTWKAVAEDDLANISYTSGTTADPKGIMLTHGNYLANLEQCNSLIQVPEWYTTLLILSWDHSFTHTTGLYVMIKNGASIGVVEQGRTNMETLRNIPKNINEIRPVFLLSVPALARSFKKNIESGVKAQGKRTEALFNYALRISYKYHGDAWKRKSPGQLLLKPLVKLFDKLVFSKVRSAFGDRLEYFIGGGALLDVELQRFFYAIGIPMYQGYGLTEASPVISSNTPENHKLGTSGRLVNNLELRILDEDGVDCQQGEKGEIVVKGGNVMKGYWKNDSATAETIIDGWLHTGDLGYVDEDGFLCVLGRYKSLLIANDGEKYSPEGIEEALVDNSKLIEQCMLYNNQDPYTVGLVVLNQRVLKQELQQAGVDLSNGKAFEKAIEMVDEEIKKYHAGGPFEGMFPTRWLPTATGIVAEPFSEENGLINSTLKMVRTKVADRHRDLLDYLYTPAGKQLSNERNKAAIIELLSS